LSKPRDAERRKALIMSFIAAVIANTPIWVWILFAFLLSRGFVALREREIQPGRALIVPIVFLVWGLTGLIESRGLGFDLALFAVGLAAGVFVGRALTALTPPPRLALDAGTIVMPGSPIPFVLILVSFAVKYVAAVALALNVGSPAHAEIASASALVGGVFAGMFWGRTLTQFRRALAAAGLPADWADAARLPFVRPATSADGAAS
jgi:hypothetical protein